MFVFFDKLVCREMEILVMEERRALKNKTPLVAG
jgi:hypothetical protein